MTRFFLPFSLLSVLAVPALAQNEVAPAPAGAGAAVIYRQVLPDGRIVYSDQPQKGARIERSVNLEPSLKTGSAKSGAAPAAQIARSSVRDGDATPPSPSASEQAELALMQAQMQLERARQQQAEGVEPQPGERTANIHGGSRLNEAYWERQQALAREVAEAEAELVRIRNAQDRVP